MAQGKAKRGRPKKPVPERVRFTIRCTDAEAKRVWKLINSNGQQQGKRVGVADFFLEQVGVR